MRTVATVKFSRLNGIFAEFSEYGRKCREVYEQYEASFAAAFPVKDKNAPALVVVIAANKGMCGSFNAELLSFARDCLKDYNGCQLVCVGQKATAYFTAKGFNIAKSYRFGDVPTLEESAQLLDYIADQRSRGLASEVKIIYPEYKNMMQQRPTLCSLFATEKCDLDTGVLFLPDKESMIEETARTVFASMLFELVLESALGVQAATLMTMRSAYDTATEYCIKLEGQINRLRQSAVTADVIETSNQ